MDLLTPQEAVLLAQAQTLLYELGERAKNTFLARGTTGDRDQSHSAYNLGQFAQAADVARSTVFNAMSCASSYLDDPMASKWLHESVETSEIMVSRDDLVTLLDRHRDEDGAVWVESEEIANTLIQTRNREISFVDDGVRDPF
jgi:membrane peptidoglycan carboxypeptidase